MIVMTVAAMRTHFNADSAVCLKTEERTRLRGAGTGHGEAKKQYASRCSLHGSQLNKPA